LRASSLSTVPPPLLALPEVRPLRLTLLTLELERTERLLAVVAELLDPERTALEALPLFWAEPERTALPEALPVEVPELERTALPEVLPVEVPEPERTALELEEPERLEELLVEPERTALELEELEEPVEPVLRRTSC